MKEEKEKLTWKHIVILILLLPMALGLMIWDGIKYLINKL